MDPPCREAMGRGGRARRAWWGGRDVAQLPLRQRFALPPPHACGTGRILALQLLEHMIGARHLEFAGAFDIELFDDAVVDDHRKTLAALAHAEGGAVHGQDPRSEEHTSELQSLLRISYAGH